MAKHEESYHLAPTEEDSLPGDEPPYPPPPTRWLTLHSTFLAVAYLILILLYLTLIGNVYPFSNSPPQSVPSSPLSHEFPSLHEAGALEYETRTWPVNIHNNPFSGKPRPELEEAWHGLFEKNNIRVRQEDLEFYNVTSLRMTDGNGWVGQMGVFHELHCLKRVRHWIYRDHYLADAPEAVLIEEEAHVDHCMELLREAILCRGDPTLSGFRWIGPDEGGEGYHLTVEAPGYHTCVNWEKLRAWNDERAVNAFEPGVLVGPH
ncbi:hypothetical protein ASPCADRAFT_406329 [Aspergillus carbonarius ITEM 5010]|uniref:Uncharacterized protein n=1 Tax=Aspergillus carbonarius (strain ITEM 5010) TaxID=602072 RepID=A0A1R3RM71_ASPC5|nr:hypothetical protein ASPCADRAFT_406329 [Aspergillus carbonarius ITEM 5010]